MLTPGIDTSHWDGHINWPVVAQSGVVFTINKCTQGDTILDTEYRDNHEGAYVNGVSQGPYVFDDPMVSPTREAAFLVGNAGTAINVYAVDAETTLLNLVQGNTDLITSVAKSTGRAVTNRVMRGLGEYPPALKDEVGKWITSKFGTKFLTMGASAADSAMSLHIYNTLLEIQRLTKVPDTGLLFYSSPGFVNAFMRPCSWADKLPFWVAHYHVSQPQLPIGWTKWLIWQYSDDGHVNGITSVCDLDYFNGTREECIKFFGNGGTNPVPTPIVPEKVTPTTTVNLRADPMDGATPIIGTSSVGKVLYPEATVTDGMNRVWYKLGKRIYVASWLCKIV